MISVQTSNNKKDYTYVRQTVFVEEQGFQEEFDEIDAIATHITLYDHQQLVGCARVFLMDGIYKFGRIAILKEFRKQGYGYYLMKACEEIARNQNIHKVVLDAQVQAQGFYEKNGYQSFGEVHFDEGEPHIYMKKQL